MADNKLELIIDVDAGRGNAAIKGVNNNLSQLERQAVSVGARASRGIDALTSSFGGLKTVLGGLGIGFGAMAFLGKMRDFAQGAIESQRAWANVTTLLDSTKESSDALYKSLRGVSSELGTTAELGKAMYLTLSANVPAEKGVQFTADAAKFAKAAVTDTYTAVDLLTTAINAYGYEVSRASEVSDKLFQMIRKGKTTGQELATSLGMVIPTAATLNVGLNELGAAFVTMTQMGINAHMATTSLNQALMAFLNPSKEAKNLAKAMGVELSASSLKANGLAKSLGDLARVSQGNEEAISTFFGNVRALRAALALTGEQAQTYVNMQKEMERSTGLTTIAFQKQVDTVGAQAETLGVNIRKMFTSVMGSGGMVKDLLKEINEQFEKGGLLISGITSSLEILAGAAIVTGLGKLATGMKAFYTALTATAAVDTVATAKNAYLLRGSIEATGVAAATAAPKISLFWKALGAVGIAYGLYELLKWIDAMDLLGRQAKRNEDAILKEAKALAEKAKQMGIVDERIAKYKDLIAEGKLQLPDIFKRGYDETAQQYLDRMKTLISEYEKLHLPMPAPAGAPPPAPPPMVDPKIAKFIADANRAAREFRRSAEEAIVGPAAKQIMEVQKEIEKLTTFVDEQGLETRVKLSAEARENIERALQLKIQALQRESVKQIVKDHQDAAQKRWEADLEYYRRRLDYEESLADRQLENARELLSYEEERAATRRDAALRQLELAEPQTLEEKVALEARRADIEIQYLKQVHEVKTALFDLETRQLITQLDLQKEVLRAAGQNVDQISGMIDEIERQRGELRGRLDEQSQAAIDAARENAAIRQGQIVRDEQRRIFDSLKRQAEGVFDALVTRSESVFSAIGNAFRTAMLTAIKEIVTSQVARLLMQLFGGLRVPVGGGVGAGAGGGGGIVGMLGGLAATPGGGFTLSGIPGVGGGLGTPPFLPAGGGGSRGGLGGLMNLGGLKEFLGFGGGVQYAPGHAATWGASTFGQKLSALGRSNAALLGGATLALLGIQRGGWSGLGMTTAGGALIGFKYGGPLGAAIGAGVGVVVGLFGLFRKSAEKKVREKVRATYGVDIQDKGVRQQIVEIAKQGFGGNLDMAIRSAEVRELVELYALTTGQSTAGLPAKMTPLSLVQTGGSLYQQAGSPSAPTVTPLPGAGLDRIGAGSAANAGPTVINITVPGAKEFFEKETVRVVVENPRAVQSAGVRATKSNYNRRELTSLQLSPGTLTS